MSEEPRKNEKALIFREKTGKPVICTGGRSYYVIRSDGSIYRCLYNPTKIGSIHDEELVQFSGSDMVCLWRNRHDRLDDTCHPSGDLMFATYWEDGVKHEAPWPFWEEPSDPSISVKDKAYFIILPVNAKCNFQCPYCCNYYFESKDGKVLRGKKDHFKDMPLEDFTKFADKCSKKLKWAHFGFLGGEPTLYPHLPELCAYVVNNYNWEAGICSNMSITSCFRKITELITDPEKKKLMKFSASLHPSSPGFSFETYFLNCKICVDAGFEVRATLVSWPEQTYAFEMYRDKLAEIGVYLWLKGCGGYEMQPDWEYIGKMGGTKQTPEMLKEIGWIGPKTEPAPDR